MRTEVHRFFPKDPADAVILILTYSHALDFQPLRYFARLPLAYLGVIASKSKAARFRHAAQREELDTTRHAPYTHGLGGYGRAATGDCRERAGRIGTTASAESA